MPNLSKCCGVETWEVSESKLRRCSKCGNSYNPNFKEEGEKKCCLAQDSTWEDEFRANYSHTLEDIEIFEGGRYFPIEESLIAHISQLLSKERAKAEAEAGIRCFDHCKEEREKGNIQTLTELMIQARDGEFIEQAKKKYEAQIRSQVLAEVREMCEGMMESEASALALEVNHPSRIRKEERNNTLFELQSKLSSLQEKKSNE